MLSCHLLKQITHLFGCSSYRKDSIACISPHHPKLPVYSFWSDLASSFPASPLYSLLFRCHFVAAACLHVASAHFSISPAPRFLRNSELIIHPPGSFSFKDWTGVILGNFRVFIFEDLEIIFSWVNLTSNFSRLLKVSDSLDDIHCLRVKHIFVQLKTSQNWLFN